MAPAIALALLITVLCSTARAQDARPPRRCGPQTRMLAGSSREPGSTPVLLVHGFQGSPSNFAKTIEDGEPSLATTLPALPGVAVYTFNYSAWSHRWVTYPTIGPALARAITCLYEATGQQVVVIAHSMGGLATRYAQAQVIEGTPVSDALARVITIGTPNEGVILLSIVNGDVSNIVVRAATEAANAACDEPPQRPRRDLCNLLRAASIPAVQAMDPDSPRLAALPPWDPDLIVNGVAADLRLRVSVLGLGTTVSLGDIVVTVDTATADANPRGQRFVARCNTGLTDLIEVVDRSRCSHANEMSNRRIMRHVVQQVQAAQHLT
jgi:pimeloyl-ACP methyl ester carboxylesterase